MERIDRKYKVIRPLGSGMSGEVFLVEDPSGQTMALKLLKGWQKGIDPVEALAHFRGEFSLLKDLKHPGIAGILDFGRDAELDRYYFTAEHVDGKDFITATADKKIGEIETLFVQVLRALEHLHARGIVHLDIKPANLLVMGPPRSLTVKLIDFGLAGERLRHRMAGTPSTMAPEVVLGEEPDGRADLYSLGVLLYEALTGTNPFRAETIAETLERQKRLKPPPASRTGRDLPPYLDRILDRLLAKNRSERYPNAAQVIRDLNLLSGKDYPVETPETLLSYLPEGGALVGRTEELAVARRFCLSLREGEPKRQTLWISGGKGCGKSRFLAEMKYFCQLNDLPVLVLSPQDVASFGVPPDEVIIFLDDLHRWSRADEEKWCAALDKKKGGRLLFIAAGEGEGFPLAFPRMESDPSHLVRLRLSDFSQNDLKRYLVSLTGLEEPPEPLVGALWERTGGNPLFVSEILKALIGGGLLFDRQGRWRLTTLEDIRVDFEKLALPRTIAALLQSRFASFPPGRQELLALLSFSPGGMTPSDLEQIAGVEGVMELDSLRKEGLVRQNWETGKVTLVNPLWHDRIVSGLDLRRQEGLRDRLAGWLSSKGRHEEASLQWGFGSNPERAIEALLPIARDFLKRGEGEKAIPLLSRIASIAEEKEPRFQVDLFKLLGDAYLQADRYEECALTYRRIRPLLNGIENRDENIFYKVDLHEKLASVALRLRRGEEAKEDIQSGLALLSDYRDDPVRRLILENDLAQLMCQEGRLDRAEALFEKTQQTWESLPAADQERVTNNDLGFLFLLKGEPEKAVRHLERQLKFAGRLSDRYPEARTCYNLAEACRALKNRSRAASHYEWCVAMAREAGSYDLLLRAYNGLGNLCYEASTQTESEGIGSGFARPIPQPGGSGEGRRPPPLDEGIDHYSRALAIAERLQDRPSQAAIHCNLGILYQKKGEAREAEHHLLGAVRIIKAVPEKSAYDLNYLARAHLELGSLLREKKEFEEARDHLRDAENLTQEHPSLKGLKFWVLYELACLYRDQGRGEELGRQIKALREAASSPSEMRKIEEIQVPSGKEVSAPRPVVTEQTRVEKGAGEGDPWKGLLKILRFLNSERDLDFLLKMVLHYALDLGGAETALILLKNPEGRLEVRAALQTVLDEGFKTFSTRVAERALTEGRAVVTDEAESDPQFAEAASVHLLKLRSILAVPVATPSGPVGVLYLDTRIQTGDFRRPGTIDLVQAFADQAAIAIENTRLFQAVEASRRNLAGELGEVQGELSLARSLLSDESVQFQTRYSYKNIATRSKRMQEIFRLLDRITDTPLTVLINGETGTGKELVARALHYNGPRRARPFVAVNCGAIPSDLMESELFGHKVGAFTGAVRDKIGLCEAADGGTLFLDEVGELSLALQVKLLRFIQEREFRRVGETEVRRVDVRILSATHQDLEKKVREGGFREDLFFRICEIRIDLPPLRERREDIPLLVRKFLDAYQSEVGSAKKFKVEKELLRRMVDYSWPGNVRELENLIRVASALAEDQTIGIGSLPSHSPLLKGRRAVADRADRPFRPWSEHERIFITHAYKHHLYRAIPTARAIGITPPTLYKRIKEWHLEDPENSLYREPFTFVSGTTLKSYQVKVFQAALEYHRRPYTALRALGVSQGYFYKVMKGKRDDRVVFSPV